MSFIAALMPSCSCMCRLGQNIVGLVERSNRNSLRQSDKTLILPSCLCDQKHNTGTHQLQGQLAVLSVLSSVNSFLLRTHPLLHTAPHKKQNSIRKVAHSYLPQALTLKAQCSNLCLSFKVEASLQSGRNVPSPKHSGCNPVYDIPPTRPLQLTLSPPTPTLGFSK